MKKYLHVNISREKFQSEEGIKPWASRSVCRFPQNINESIYGHYEYQSHFTFSAVIAIDL